MRFNRKLTVAVLLLAIFQAFTPWTSTARCADLSITATSVVTTSTQVKDVTSGATITAGMPVYLDASDSDKAKIADANDTSAKAVVAGIALHGATSGQPLRIVTGGTYTVGATVTVGTIYVLSDEAGLICPASDLAQNHYVSVLGVATSSTVMNLILKNSGVQVP